MSIPQIFAPIIMGFLVFGISGCNSAVIIEPAQSSNSVLCTSIDQRTPVLIGDQLLRETTPQYPGSAAWGDPAIVMRCGVSVPSELTATSQVIDINGITWFPQELTAGTRFTSTNTSTPVEVSIPSGYESAASILVEIGSIIAGN